MDRQAGGERRGVFPPELCQLYDRGSVCQIDSTLNGVSPDACNAMLATLLAAKATGAQVMWDFNDSLTCDLSSFNSGNW